MLLQALVLVSLLWILTLIDLETGLLPNVLTFPGIATGLAFSWQFGYLQDAVIGAVVGYGAFWMIARLFLLMTGREGMGYGDFKLLAMLGAFMGWQALPFIVLASSFTGAVIGSLFLLMSQRHIRAEIPFGPYLAAAGMVWFLWGRDILQWYAGLIHV
jgi:leader peptidase (prepilin peptidase)/N-methyltransferase